MKFTLSWLKDHLDTDASLDEIVERLTSIGLEVESVDDKARLKPFVIAKVLTELHGGQLHIRSTKDVGTEVSVVLPLRDRVSVAKDPGAAILKDMTSDLDPSVQHREL